MTQVAFLIMRVVKKNIQLRRGGFGGETWHSRGKVTSYAGLTEKQSRFIIMFLNAVGGFSDVQRFKSHTGVIRLFFFFFLGCVS